MASSGAEESPRPRDGAGPSDLPRAIHRALANKELERDYASAEALRVHPELAKFIAWVADKDPDFHAPTRRPR